MTALSIRRMNFTLQALAHIRDQRDAEWYASLPNEQRDERSHYWFVKRRAKRGGKWVFVCDFIGTKAETARFWKKHFQGKKDHRLFHQLRYG